MTRTIFLDQMGYRPQDRKKFIVEGPGGEFQILTEDTGKVIFCGQTTSGKEDSASGQMVASGDFSSLTQEGNYVIRMTGSEESYPLVIREDAYADIHQALLKAFYYFRCGMELTEEHAGIWTHDSCHTGKGIVYGETRERDGNGGWHDAGDYGKYTVPGAKAVADLLLAYEWNPHAFENPFQIPETGNGWPDVLSECKYELDFLLKMQDEESGGAFHKLTTEKFCGLHVMPEDDRAKLVFSPISSTATGCFSAVMALASRVYQKIDADFSERCLSAADRAWNWLLKHPEGVIFKNPPEIKTGEYGDNNDRDERFWAAAELYRTTGKTNYHETLKDLLEQGGFPLCELGWRDVGGYGTLAYLFMDQSLADASVRKMLGSTLHEHAKELMEVIRKDGFLVSLLPSGYRWGSNMDVLNHGMLLLAAALEYEDHSFKEAAKEAALEQLHYILGRNVNGQSYVSGYGTKPLMNPHYRPGAGDGIEAPVPGMISGGPCAGLLDDYAKAYLAGNAPAACFADHELSYSTNEVTIYWNSPAVFVTSFFV